MMEHLGEAARADRVSYWMASAGGQVHDSLMREMEVDVAVVGGGIVGITTALLLARAGREVAVVEADRVAAGVSGYTTAKVTAGHGLIYSRLEQRLGPEVARLYAESQLRGLSCVSELCGMYGIGCDLESQPNYVVADTEGDGVKLDAEIDAARRAGLDVGRVSDLGVIPYPAIGALVLHDQSQFHVRKYLLALARLIVESGGTIFEHSRVVEITGIGPYEVRTGGGTVRARAVVVATHYPIVEQGFFVTRIHPRRSYVVAAALDDPAPDGMFINAGSPSRSVRTVPLDDGRRLLLVGGEGHPVGRGDDTSERYALLEQFMRTHFRVGKTLFWWSTQDNFSIDGLPYIGRIDAEGELYVATGFAGWGMTNGTMAALVIKDAIERNENRWSALYDPNRASIGASAKSFLAENTRIAPRLMAGSLGSRTVDSVDELAVGEGALLSTAGSDCAVSRDAEGELHVLSSVCTHMGCTVSWNQAESTWDCPCHGSRFAANGRVLHGPALWPLEPADIRSARERSS